MSKIHVRTGDTVEVISGKDKGKKGKVLEVHPGKGMVVVEKVNIVTKHKKPRGQKDMGGIVKVEGALRACKVMLVCPKCSTATRIGHMILADGEKTRMCKKCGDTI